MINYNKESYFQWKLLSWENSYLNLFRLQRRLLKSVFVSDNIKALLFQKLILNSNSARLLSIREVTQISLTKNIAGVDGKTSLTFTERFELNENLKLNIHNWLPHAFRRISLIRKNGSIAYFDVSTISDRVWQMLIKYSMDPSYEAIFSFRNYGFRFGRSIHDLQQDVLLSLSQEAYGYQKRVIKLTLINSLSFFDFDFILRNILVPRGVKLGLFRLFKLGFKPFFSIDFVHIFGLNALIANIILHGIEDLFPSFRFGHDIVLLLYGTLKATMLAKPLDKEDLVLNRINTFLFMRGMELDMSCISFSSVHAGFDFLDWTFKLDKSFCSISYPAYDNYQVFLKRVKLIVNNSNYGANIKVAKLLPIVKDWKEYHKYCDIKNAPFSLFFMKKRAFKVFSNEAKQDAYSTKRLLDKCFNAYSSDLVNSPFIKASPYYGHNVFWINYKYNFINKIDCAYLFHKKDYLCIHCGVSLVELTNFFLQ
uniref:group II intron reverse transcriptase/maturase mat1 n=1 Tax=Strombomonas costata TaxID=161230 RepID=UPI0023AACB0F|nr:group II intron reverse transcriptase/maturase mat1 [Strombomonas costata]WCH63644.1 group II intron reverse transcriptase/maturase mat1 [Strombomonas costata]